MPESSVVYHEYVGTALVLSAGGMFAAWQAGAWAGLAGRLKPDMVIGASAGALNGWAIAGGITPEELAAAWLNRDMADLMRPRFPWPTLFDPAPLRRTAGNLFNDYRPCIPFATLLVELPRLRLRLVRGEDMTWRHLAAACSIPGAFPPVRLDGHWYADGGLLGALPLWAAAEMGATRAIALDALPVMPSKAIRFAVRCARLLGAPRQAPESLSDLHLPEPAARHIARCGALVVRQCPTMD